MRDPNCNSNNGGKCTDNEANNCSSCSNSNATATTQDGFASDNSTVDDCYKSEAENDNDAEHHRHHHHHHHIDHLPSTTANANANANANAASEPEDVNELLSRELLKMSLIDRQDVQEEIHCVRCLSVEETPGLIQRSLQDFQKELEALPDFKKKTYNQIVDLALAEEATRNQCSSSNCDATTSNSNANSNSNGNATSNSTATSNRNATSNSNTTNRTRPPRNNYAIDDEDFRLRFLRVELFDFKKAALRFVNYFEFVHEFFGFEIASKRQVRLSDFSKEELRFFKKGSFQLLPFRDRRGRRVAVILGETNGNNNGNNNDNNNDKNIYQATAITRAKFYFYLLDVATRDSAESQRRGVVSITHPTGICFDLSNHELYLIHRLSLATPTRIVASHNFCNDFAGYKLLAKAVVAHVIAGSKHKQIIRQKFHVGLNDTEMRYSLQGFGIPIQFFPLTETGTIKLKYFNKWIKTRIYLETKGESTNNNINNNNNNNNMGTSATATTTTSTSKENSSTKKKNKTVVVVECPLLNDVVFRQGKPYKANPGNDVLRDSILEELNRKMMASTASKNNTNNTYGNTNGNNISNTNGNGSTSSHKTTNIHSNNGLGKSNNNGLGLSNEHNGSGHSSNNSNNSNSGGNCNEVADSTEHFCNWLVDEIEINRKGRFLTWDSTLNTWVQMFDRFKIRRKISVTLYNYEKRHSTALGKMQQRKDKAVARSLLPSLDTTDHSSSSFVSTNTDGMAYDDLAYRFIEGGKPSSQFCCLMNMTASDNNNNNNSMGAVSRNNNNRAGERKRSRDFFSFHT